MNVQTLRIAIVFAVLALAFGSNALFGQAVDYRIVPLTAADNGTGVATDTFGVHINGTYGKDGLLTPGGFLEEELPPKPPAGVFDFRFTDHRTPGELGTGQKVHIQEGGKIDTFKIEFQPSDGGYPFTFTWPSGLGNDWQTLKMVDAFTGGLIFSVDMLTNTTGTVTNPPGLTSLYIIGEPKTLDVQQDGNLLPQNFELQQNYPNPFNPSTTIRFAIQKVAFADVAVYNVIGQKVKNLASKVLTPGYYTTTWNGTDESGQAVTSGVYFVRMFAKGEGVEFSDLRKLLLVK